MGGRLGVGVESSILLARIVLVNMGMVEILTGIEDGAVIAFCDFFGDGKCDWIYDGVRLLLYTWFVLNCDGEHM